MAIAVEESFQQKHIVQPNDCWVWTASVGSHGYGNLWEGSTKTAYTAHRWSYEHFVGPIPDGYEIHHLCENKRCVNPEHLRALTRSEHRQTSEHKKTHCPHGHAYTEENTYVRPCGKIRECRTCQHNADLRRRSPQREAA